MKIEKKLKIFKKIKQFEKLKNNRKTGKIYIKKISEKRIKKSKMN